MNQGIKMNQEIKTNKYNSTISVFRALAAFLVISQHVPYEGSLQIVPYFMCTAVPFFFLVAGYFSWSQEEAERRKKIWKHLKKIVLVYIGAYLFYYFISVGMKYAINSLFHKNIAISFENWNVLEILKGIALDIDPFASHLWFLYSMIFIYLLLFVFHRDKMIIPGAVLSVILYGLAHTKFGDGSTLATIRVAVTSSFSTAYFGYFIHYLEEKKGCKQEAKGCKKETKNLLFICISILICLYLCIQLFFTNIFTHHGYTEYLAMGMFLIAMKYKNIGEGTILERIGMKYTLWIYVFHIFIMHIWERIVQKLTFVPSEIWKELNCVIIYGITLGIVIAFEKIRFLIIKRGSK